MYISLGSACDCNYHIKRLQLESLTVPFNSSATNHQVLIDSISTDFSKVFKTSAMVVCHNTQFHWGHRALSYWTDEIWDIWNHQVSNFLSLKGREVTFMRKTMNHSPQRNKQEHQELVDCLRSNGYRGELLFGVFPKKNEDSFFVFDRPADNDNSAWIGCNEEWDEFILNSPRYQI